MLGHLLNDLVRNGRDIRTGQSAIGNMDRVADRRADDLGLDLGETGEHGGDRFDQLNAGLRNIIQTAKALSPILVPLFISAFRRADELAVAMECRCYHGGEGRTKLHVLQYEGRDYLALALGLAVTAGIIVLRQFT